MIAVLALLPAALALDGNDEMQLTLRGGSVVTGRYLRVSADGLVLSGEDGPVDVPMVLVESAVVDGDAMGVAELSAALATARESLAVWLVDPPPHPAPAVVIGASMLWAGAGHAALGDWRSLAAYSVVEGVLWTAAAVNIAQQDARPLLPLLGLDIAFKVWSARESSRTARQRREILMDVEETLASP